MTVEEMLAREAIRQTLAAYTAAGDRLREEEFLAVFTEDGVLETEHVAQADLFRYAGRAAIREWITRWRNPAAGARTHQASFVRHHLSTCHIELTGEDTARARTYWVAYTDIGPDHCGYYLDAFRREGARWLIAHRRIREDWRSPHSLFTNAVARTR
jgi:3-phenylpropionate/cinnamic acid dioxygenase small subunit